MLNVQHIAVLQASVVRHSDEMAYKKLFYHFHPLLRRFANSLVEDSEVADEIVSDVLLKLWTMRQKLAIVQDLKLYLFKATRNTCLNYLKSSSHRYNKDIEPIGEGLVQTASPESDYIYSELHQCIAQAVNELPAKCQQVFRLVKEYGLSYAQVGEIMSISQNTMETHMRLALKKLKTVVDNYKGKR